MDPLIANLSFGLIFTGATAGFWVLHKEHKELLHKYKTLYSRFDEVEKIFTEIKDIERQLRKKQGRQAPMHLLEQKIFEADRKLKAIKARAA